MMKKHTSLLMFLMTRLHTICCGLGLAIGLTLASLIFSGHALAQDEQPIAILAGHTNGVYSVAYSPDGKLLATKSNLWNKNLKEA